MEDDLARLQAYSEAFVVATGRLTCMHELFIRSLQFIGVCWMLIGAYFLASAVRIPEAKMTNFIVFLLAFLGGIALVRARRWVPKFDDKR
jgi:hypothetical protein